MPAPPPSVTREVRLVAEPKGLPGPELAVVAQELHAPGPGQVLVHNRYFLVFPGLRTLIGGAPEGVPLPTIHVGDALFGPAVGEVVAAGPGSRLRPGDIVTHLFGWREHALVAAADCTVVDDALPDPATHLSSDAAYGALTRLAAVRPGDTVLVTGAAGGVGSPAGPVARLLGAGRVIGTTRSPVKAERLHTDLGYDSALVPGDQSRSLTSQSREAAPEGIDVVLDTVGGEQLTAALAAARRGARVALVGALSGQLSPHQDGDSAPARIDTFRLITQRNSSRRPAPHRVWCVCRSASRTSPTSRRTWRQASARPRARPEHRTDVLPGTSPAGHRCLAGGDPPGRRRWYSREKPLSLEAGGELPGARLAFETWGRLAPDASNAVLVLHALTGDSHVAGPAGPGHPTPGWWDGLVGPGRALDPDHWFVVAPNVLGGCQGSTGPSSPTADGRRWGGDFPFLTQRDQVAAEAGLADAPGIDRWALVVGGSMGGMRALEWAVSRPGRTGALLLLATTAAASAEQIAWADIRLRAIRADRNWLGGHYHDTGRGPHTGLGLARRIAHVTYRSEPELHARFGRTPQGPEDPGDGGRYQVESYLDHHAAKLVRRFDAGSYVVLSEAMNSHDVGRGRGGVRAALRRVTAPTLVAGVDSDRLHPPAQQAELAAGIPTADGLRLIGSPHGHDGFLIEVAQVADLVGELLPRKDAGRGRP